MQTRRMVLCASTLILLSMLPARTAPCGDEPAPATLPRATLPAGPRPFKIFDGKPKTIALLTSSHRGDGELFSRIRKMPGAEQIALRRQGYCTDEDGRREFPSSLPPPPEEMPDYCPRQKLQGAEPAILIVMGGAVRAKDFPPVPGICTPEEAIERGVETMCAGVKRAEAQGVAWVMLSTMHYNPNVAWPHCVGWERAGELVAAYNKTETGQRHPAVDVSSPLRPHCPLYLSWDMYHCNGYGREMVAHLWFSALCAWDGIETPAWSWEMVQAAKQRDLKDRECIGDVHAREIPWAQGGSQRALEVTWSADTAQGDFGGEFFRCEQYYAARGGRSGAGCFCPLTGAQITQQKGLWKLLWPLPAAPGPQDTFRNGDHYFIKVVSRRTSQWNVCLPVQLGPGGDPAPWSKRP